MKKEDWQVIVVVPLSLFAVAVPVLAFSTNPVAATQFFGTLAAAAIAAGAVIFNAQYQSKLTRDRDDRIKHELRIEKAIELYGFVHFLGATLTSIKAGLSSKDLFNAQNPSKDDLSTLTVGYLRQVINSDFDISWDRAIECASSLPTELARRILSNIYLVRHDSTFFYKFAAFKDDTKLRRDNVDALIRRLDAVRKSMFADRKAIATYLQSVGADVELPPDEN